MINEIILKVVLTIVGCIVTGSFGFLVGKIKSYKQRDDTKKKALKCLLRSSITSKYYVYSELKTIPLYEKENLNYMYEQYKAMGGNSYINEIMEEINKLPIKK